MFSNGFPKEWSTLRKLAWLFRTVINAVSPVLKTIIGNPIHITDALAKPVQALSIALEPIQAGSGDPSPDNIRPIYGHTDADVTRTGKNLCYKVLNGLISLGTDTAYFYTLADARSLVFECKAGQTYIASGLTMNRCIWGVFDSVPTNGAQPIAYQGYAQPQAFTPTKDGVCVLYVSNVPVDTSTAQIELGSTATAYEEYRGTTYPIPLGTTVYGGVVEWIGGDKWRVTSYPYYASYNGETLVGPWISSMDKYEAGATPTTGAQVVDFGGTPTTFTITTTELFSLLQGENNLFSDGTMTLTYLADGNASDAEALNILLGGRYVNNHEADEPTDREALDILLGGTR